MKSSIALAKITRPVVSGVVARKRLFGLIDGARRKPLLWISAPSGAGKTTLVGSYLSARRLPCLWFQIDSGDSDIATFFYYMAMAAKILAPRRRRPMPLLTAEYLMGVPAFTRRFFEELFGRIEKPPFMLVFDNYQEAGQAPAFNEVMREGFSILPEGFNAIVMSREAPPEVFARMMAGGVMETAGWDVLRLTQKETEDILKARGFLKGHKGREIYKKTGGWAAGVMLMLEKAGGKGHLEGKAVPETVFDYFSSEVLGRLDPGIRGFLLKSAFLPGITADMAGALTGLENAEGILSGHVHIAF